MPLVSSLFSEYGDEKSNTTVVISSPKQLLAVNDNILFAWTAKGLVALINVRLDSEKSELAYDFHTFLHLTVIPFGRVQQLLINRTGSLLALMCNKYCYVVEIPRILRLFKSQSELEPQYLCKCRNVDLNLSGSDRTYMKILWHPGSANASHLAALTSDNIIRIYAVEKSGCKMVQALVLGASNEATFSANTPRMCSMLSSIGESAVSFDFGSPIDTHHLGRVSLYPLYILYGNGDVYSVFTDPIAFRKFPVKGPLTVTPPAEDNYGSDSCDILALISSKRLEAITTLIIATSYGNLYHCIVSTVDRIDDDSCPELCLHVYETAELEFSLSTVDLSTKQFKQDSAFSPIMLHRDDCASDVYYCTHGAGVHFVTLPWMYDFEALNRNSGNQDNNSDLMAGYDKGCHVEYKLCTCPGQNERLLPPFGLASMFRNLSNRILILLTCDFTFQIIKLNVDILYGYQLNEPALSVMKDEAKTRSNAVKNISFIEQVKTILKRDASVPMLRLQRSMQNISELEACELLLRTIDIMNIEYLKKINEALIVSQERVQSLTKIYDKQSSDVNTLMKRLSSKLLSEKDGLMEKAAKIQEEQARQQEKLEQMSSKLSEKRNSLSQAEENMASTLKSMRVQADLMTDKFAKVKQSVESQFTLFNEQRYGEIFNGRTNFGKAEIEKMLDDQNRQIDGLLNEIGQLQVDK